MLGIFTTIQISQRYAPNGSHRRARGFSAITCRSKDVLYGIVIVQQGENRSEGKNKKGAIRKASVLLSVLSGLASETLHC
jgi:hypothetical protein